MIFRKFWEKGRLEKKSQSQMGFEPTTLRALVGCSTTEPLETLWRGRVKLWVLTGTASRGYTAMCLADMNPL